MENNLKKKDSEELKKIQIQILDVVDDFCNKNKIKYWLNAGTLLGAVRHGGYIPWNDIDLGMLREDFDKKNFSETIKKEFEGKEYNVPIGYVEWLTTLYGDYMKLPPEEKQVTHHILEAYYKE